VIGRVGSTPGIAGGAPGGTVFEPLCSAVAVFVSSVPFGTDGSTLTYRSIVLRAPAAMLPMSQNISCWFTASGRHFAPSARRNVTGPGTGAAGRFSWIVTFWPSDGPLFWTWIWLRRILPAVTWFAVSVTMNWCSVALYDVTTWPTALLATPMSAAASTVFWTKP
jgi:hypothetical protein